MAQKEQKSWAERKLEEVEEQLRGLESESSQDPGQEWDLAQLLYQRASLLARLKRWDECLRAYDQFLQRFPHPQGTKLRQLVAQALFDKGTILLHQQDQQEAGLQVYRELVERFRLDKNVMLRRLVSGAQSMIDLFESSDPFGLE